MKHFLLFIIINSIIILLFIIGVLIFTAAFTLIERKMMGLFQRREGPDQAGIEGLGQPFADGLKLLRKEIIIPKDSPEQKLFIFAPIFSLWISLFLWSFIPFSSAGAFFQEEMSLLLILGFSSLGSYGIIYAGWTSNNKYALLGAFRAVAQFISYEIIFSILFLPIIGITGSLSLYNIVQFQIVEGWFSYLIPLWILSFIVLLAETNRTPFDLPEAEAELVAGFNVEYSSLLFAFFFLAEYSAMGFFSAIFISLFFGGWSFPTCFCNFFSSIFIFSKEEKVNYFNNSNPYSRFIIDSFDKIQNYFLDIKLSNDTSYFWFQLIEVGVFCIKIQCICLFFIFVRASLPRQRFDQLIQLCWKYIFPVAFSFSFFIISVYFSFLHIFINLYKNHYIFI